MIETWPGISQSGWHHLLLTESHYLQTHCGRYRCYHSRKVWEFRFFFPSRLPLEKLKWLLIFFYFETKLMGIFSKGEVMVELSQSWLYCRSTHHWSVLTWVARHLTDLSTQTCYPLACLPSQTDPHTLVGVSFHLIWCGATWKMISLSAAWDTNTHWETCWKTAGVTSFLVPCDTVKSP